MRNFKDKALTVRSSKKVEKIEIRVVMSDAVGKLWVTDIMTQGGELATIWSAHTSELRWSFDL